MFYPYKYAMIYPDKMVDLLFIHFNENNFYFSADFIIQ